jgi:prolipoprotein diacylglyceryltransferase
LQGLGGLAEFGFFHFMVEFVRIPDQQYGYLLLDWIIMGQILSLAMIVLGSFLRCELIVEPVKVGLVK